MLTETGRVVAVDSDGLWVETLQKSVCSGCSARHGCGQQLLARASRNMSLIKALFRPGETGGPWNVGDTVSIGMQESALLRAALFVYLVPLAGLVFFVLLGAWLGFSDGILALSGVGGILLGGLIVRIHAQIMGKLPTDRFSYHAVVLSQNESPSVLKPYSQVLESN